MTATKQKARRQRGEGSVFQRASDGLWVGKVDLGLIDGKRRRRVVYAKTQQGAVQKLAKAKAARDAGNFNTASPTLEQWLARWLDEVCPSKRIKPRTLANYRSYARNYLVPAIGKVRLDRLGAQHVRELHRYVYGQRKPDGSELSPTTAGHAHRILGTALNDAMKERLVLSNPVSLVDTPTKDEDGGREALSLPEVGRFFRVVDGQRLAARWHTGFLQGLRQGEVLGMRWDAVDLDSEVLDIAWQLQRIPYKHGCERTGGAWSCGRKGADRCPLRALDVRRGFVYEQLDGNLCLQRPKTKKSRVVPMTPALAMSLRERHAAYLAERDAYRVDHRLVFARPDGRPIDGSDDRREWHELLKAAQIPDADQHAMRHTTSTILLALGVQEHVRMAILGHSQAATNRSYTHVDLTQMRDAMATLDSAMQRELT